MLLFLLILTISLSAIIFIQFAYLAFLTANNEQLRKQLAEMYQLQKFLEPMAGVAKPQLMNDESWPEFLEK